MPAKEGRRWSIREGRVAGHYRRRDVRVRVATGGEDVVLLRLREERKRGSEEHIRQGGMVEVVGVVPLVARGARVRGAHRDDVVR
jgi:hypothetical protein